MKLGIAAVMLVSLTTSAQGQRLVIRSHTIKTPVKEVRRLTAPVESSLMKSGNLTTSDRHVAQALAGFSRRGTAKVVKRLRAQLVEGHRLWRQVKFADVIRVFTGAIAEFQRAPAIVLSKEDREGLLDAYVALALAHKRSGDLHAAERVMGDLVRSFPDQKISFRRFGPEPLELRKRVQSKLDKQGKGTLRLKVVGDSRAELFVNDRSVGPGPVTLSLHAGRYRIFAVTKHRVSRVRKVSVLAVAGLGVQKAAVDLRFDFAVALRPHALVFATEAQREKYEAAFALRLSRIVGLRGAIVLGVRTLPSGGRALVGKVVSAKGRVVRQGVVNAEKNIPVNRLYALADFLHDGTKRASDVFSNVVSLKPRGFRFGRWPWLSVGVGVVSIAAGSVLLWLDTKNTCTLVPPQTQCPRIYDNRTGGIVSITGGAVAIVAALGAVLYDRRQNQRRRRLLKKYERRLSVKVSQRSWAVVVNGRF